MTNIFVWFAPSAAEFIEDWELSRIEMSIEDGSELVVTNRSRGSIFVRSNEECQGTSVLGPQWARVSFGNSTVVEKMESIAACTACVSASVAPTLNCKLRFESERVRDGVITGRGAGSAFAFLHGSQMEVASNVDASPAMLSVFGSPIIMSCSWKLAMDVACSEDMEIEDSATFYIYEAKLNLFVNAWYPTRSFW
ncbi:hypothetical protein BDQ17DRAFT_1334740 [Cyathus striatus]|nr:hypothetical protein BDQ17DRAFT_1334740 [Cyathus striatus]